MAGAGCALEGVDCCGSLAAHPVSSASTASAGHHHGIFSEVFSHARGEFLIEAVNCACVRTDAGAREH
jgi:hypothetical protein